jgi:large subunit ribosomal protein L19e
MKLESKKSLASRSLGVGKNRIAFNKERLTEIKESITKQDMRDLNSSGAIIIKEIKGKKKITKRRTRRRAGSIKKKVNKGKENYVKITRKLRAYISELKKQNKISLEDYRTLRKEIRTSVFRSKAHIKERIALLGTETKFKFQTKKKARRKKKK